MCKEYLTIAICAPQKAPSMSFTCGQLHLVAERRQVCDKATGNCLCFIGTCGTLENIPSTQGIQMSSVKSIRCAACTSREEEVGDRRTNEELIGSQLLNRTAIKSPEQKQKFDEIIKNLWNGKHECPYHAASAILGESNGVPVTTKHASEVDMDKNDNKDTVNKPLVTSPCREIANDNVSEASSNATYGSNESSNSDVSQESEKMKEGNNGLGRKVGLQASIWANAPDKTPERKKHTSSPRFQSPVKRQKPAAPQGPKPRMNLPQIAAAKSFLKETTV